MTGGRGASNEIDVIRIPIDPIILRAIETLGTGPNVSGKLTWILDNLLTNRLEDINARILKCQADELKRETTEMAPRGSGEKSAEKSKRSVAVQQQLLELRQFLSSYKPSTSEVQENKPTQPELVLNLAQFFVLYVLGDKKSEFLDEDLGALLLDLGNMQLSQQNARLAKERVKTETQPVALEDTSPDLLQQKEFLAILGELEELKEKKSARDRRISQIERGNKQLVDICAKVLQVPVNDVQSAVEILLQKEQAFHQNQSYQALYKEFQQIVKDFESIARQLYLENQFPPQQFVEKENIPQLEPSQLDKLLKKKTRKKAVSARKASLKEELSPPSKEISETTILDKLSSTPMDIRDLITAMGITDMHDARYLQVQLRELETNNQVLVKIEDGRKYYLKL